METLRDILWPVVLVGGLGGLIDFLIGQAGQAKAKDFLLKWWVRFDDVRWRNFGREEGLFAGQLLEKWLGRRIWSVRRIMAFAVLFIATLSYVMVYIIIDVGKIAPAPLLTIYSLFSCRFCHVKIYSAIAIMLFFFGFSVSVSFTKFITFRMARLCGVGNAKNLIIFLIMLIVNYLMFEIWSQITGMVREIILTFITGDLHEFMHNAQQVLGIEKIQEVQLQYMTQWTLRMASIDNLALNYASSLPSLLRLMLAIVFVGSFLLRPLIMRPVNLVWRRIIESDKPVFTLTFGGAAAFATALSEAAKHL
jgi:hypothetical protein